MYQSSASQACRGVRCRTLSGFDLPCHRKRVPANFSSRLASRRLSLGNRGSKCITGLPGPGLQGARRSRFWKHKPAVTVIAANAEGRGLEFSDLHPPAGGWMKSTSDIDKAVILNTVTASGAGIADPLMSMVDTLFMGRLGTVAMAALGPNSTIFGAIFYLYTFTAAIITTELVGTAHANGDLPAVQRALVVSTVLAVVIGAMVTIVLQVVGPTLLKGMGANAEMMPDTLVYLKTRAFAAPAALLLVVAQAAYRAVLDLRTPCIIVVIAGLLNVLLDPLLMFTLGWGSAGASIATTVSQWVGVLLFYAMMLRAPQFIGRPSKALVATLVNHHASTTHAGPASSAFSSQSTAQLCPTFIPLPINGKQDDQPQMQGRGGHHVQAQGQGGLQAGVTSTSKGDVDCNVASISGDDASRDQRFRVAKGHPWSGRGIQLALPSLKDYWHYLQQCSGLLFRGICIVSIWSLASVAATGAGIAITAGHQIVNQMTTFQVTVLWAFMEVGQSMVVNAYGHDGRHGARRVGDRVVLWCIIASLLLAAATWLGQRPLARLFISDPHVLSVVESAMVPALLMILTGWNNALEGVLLGVGDTTFVVQAFFPAAGAGIAMLFYVLFRGGGLSLIWWALAMYYVLLTVQYAIRYWVPSARVLV